MAEFETVRRAGAGTQSVAIDEGLRAHMNKVYGLMSFGMLATAAVAWIVGNNEQLLSFFFATPLRWVVMFAPLIAVFAF